MSDTRRRYLFTYDIADDKRRARAFIILSGVGDRLQFSVFMADLSGRELHSTQARLSSELNHAEDQVLVVDLGAAEGDGSDVVSSIGRPAALASRVVVI